MTQEPVLRRADWLLIVHRFQQIFLHTCQIKTGNISALTICSISSFTKNNNLQYPHF